MHLMGVLAWMRVEQGQMEFSPVTDSTDTFDKFTAKHRNYSQGHTTCMSTNKSYQD